jgi:tyrosyl-tRNA synthetase
VLEGAEINEAKKILATEATRLAHGDGPAQQALETARRTFEEGAAADTLPTRDIRMAHLAAGMAAFQLFAEVGLASSNSEARRLIKGGGARLNDRPVATETQLITLADAQGGVIKLTAGKKRHLLVRLVE